MSRGCTFIVAGLDSACISCTFHRMLTAPSQTNDDTVENHTRTCEMLVTTTSGQASAGRIVLSGNVLSAEAAPGHETLMRSVMENPVVAFDKCFTAVGDPEKWFEGLPLQYTGSYLRARIVERRRR